MDESLVILPRSILLTEGERVEKIVRRHWFPLALEGFLDVTVFLLLGVSTVGIDILFSLNSVHEQIPTTPIGIFFLSFVGLILWMRFFSVWSDHWLDAWIITNKRIIDIEQHGFFKRQVSSFELEKIQDITDSVDGLIATWLHFGNVRIQTASITNDLVMQNVPFPHLVKEVVTQAMDSQKT